VLSAPRCLCLEQHEAQVTRKWLAVLRSLLDAMLLLRARRPWTHVSGVLHQAIVAHGRSLAGYAVDQASGVQHCWQHHRAGPKPACPWRLTGVTVLTDTVDRLPQQCTEPCH